MNKDVLKQINHNKIKKKKPRKTMKMQENKENKSSENPKQTLSKFAKDYYQNMSEKDFEVFCERLMTLHQTGVYVPPPPKPRVCKKKKKLHVGTRKYEAQYKKRSTKFGQGRVGVSCESFGVKNCGCCRPKNESQARILDNQKYLINKQKQSDRSKMYDQTIQDIIATYQNAQTSASTVVSDNEIEESAKYEKIIQNILLHYKPNHSLIDLTNNDSIMLPDQNNSTIILDSSIDPVPGTSSSFSRNSNLTPKVIDEIVILDSDVEDINDALITSKLNLSRTNTKENNSDKIIKTEQLNNYNTNINESVIANPIIDLDESINNVSTSNPSKMDCPVCLESFRNREIMSTICGHVFCGPCIKNCIRQTKKCPNCRKKLTLKGIHPIFL